MSSPTRTPADSPSGTPPSAPAGSGTPAGGGDSPGAENSRSLDPGAAALWQAAKAPVLVGALVLFAALVVALLSGTGPSGRALDPASTDPAGGRALARLLEAQGVEVERVQRLADARAAADEGAALLLTEPRLLTQAQLEEVRDLRVPLVVAAPTSSDLAVLAPSVEVAGWTETEGDETRAPGCDLYAAARAGATTLGGLHYAVEDADAQSCYGGDVAGAPLLVLRPGGDAPPLTLLGDPAALSNERLDEAGNAALGLNLLGQEPRLVWYLPSLADVPEGEGRTLGSLLPDWVRFGAIQLLVAVALLALWQARRLGPVVAEPLPVVVRAAEVVEGRARLYQRGRARGRAAEALRQASRRRLARRLGLTGEVAPQALVESVAAHARRPAGEVAALLYGAPGPGQPAARVPPDDRALVRLADDLDTLEREVRRP